MDDSAPRLIKFPEPPRIDEDPVVITGIGMAASVGSNREEVWEATQCGRSGIRMTGKGDGLGGQELPCGMIDWLPTGTGELKSIQLSRHVAREAIADAAINWEQTDRTQFGCSISAQFGDISYLYPQGPHDLRQESTEAFPWQEGFIPCSASTVVSHEFGLEGPRLCHATACASGLVSTLVGARAIQSGQADYMLCGAADTVNDMVLAAFNRMGVLSHGPETASACRPFDQTRSGFVMGEGCAMLVLEKRSHAIQRGAKIYAELSATQMLCQAHHVTGLDSEAETLIELIKRLVARAGWHRTGPQYINAHGTGTEQNDRSELLAIRSAMPKLADNTVISSNKAILGHLINAAGSVELALTAMAMRDSFAPPTMHLDSPEAIGQLDCLPNAGVEREITRSMKLSLAFGGHLVGMALQATPELRNRQEKMPLSPMARIRESVTMPSLKFA